MEKQAPPVRVERVIDGDTVVLTRFGETRLIGVNTPEEGRCGGNAATRFTRRRLEDRRVKHELGEQRKDRHGRTLAYLTRGDTMHNLSLVEEGYATVLTIPPNDEYAARFKAAEQRAKQRNEGPLVNCARKRRQAVALRRARARQRAERAKLAEQLARQLRAVERRARRQLGLDPGGGDGSGGGGSSGDRAPELQRGQSPDPDRTRRSREPRRRERRAGM